MSDLDATTELNETETDEAGWLRFQESQQYTALELALEDIGWRRMVYRSQQEFAKPGLDLIAELARVMAIKNPLIKRAVETKSNYVWGQGVTIAADHPDINTVIQDFLDDERNAAELTSHQARLDKDKELQTDGNIFLVLFINKLTGRVRVRSVPMAQITEILTNPDDAKEPWFYKRVWQVQEIDSVSGNPTTRTRTAYYPDLRYSPVFSKRLRQIGKAPVVWDTPIYHLKVGGFSDWRFGVSEQYAAIDWARAYKEFLEDVATLMRAYSRFAFKLTTKGGKAGVQAAKTKMSTTLGAHGGSGYDTNPPPVSGSTAIMGEGTDLNPINVRGASVAPEDGRRFLLMVAAAVGLPETFFGDANVGNHATAKTLDRPTELQMQNRQTLWANVYTTLLSVVVSWAVKTPRGPLAHLGRLERVIDGDEVVDVITWNEQPAPKDAPVSQPAQLPGIRVTFPPILVDSETRIKDIVSAATLDGKTQVGLIDERSVSRMLLEALGATNIDEMLAVVFDEQGQRKQPAPQTTNPPKTERTPGADADLPEDPTVEEAARELVAAIQPVFLKYRKAAECRS